MRLGIDDVLLEFAHQGALFDVVGLVQHCLLQIDLLLVVGGHHAPTDLAQPVNRPGAVILCRFAPCRPAGDNRKPYDRSVFERHAARRRPFIRRSSPSCAGDRALRMSTKMGEFGRCFRILLEYWGNLAPIGGISSSGELCELSVLLSIPSSAAACTKIGRYQRWRRLVRRGAVLALYPIRQSLERSGNFEQFEPSLCRRGARPVTPSVLRSSWSTSEDIQRPPFFGVGARPGAGHRRTHQLVEAGGVAVGIVRAGRVMGRVARRADMIIAGMSYSTIFS